MLILVFFNRYLQYSSTSSSVVGKSTPLTPKRPTILENCSSNSLRLQFDWFSALHKTIKTKHKTIICLNILFEFFYSKLFLTHFSSLKMKSNEKFLLKNAFQVLGKKWWKFFDGFEVEINAKNNFEFNLFIHFMFFCNWFVIQFIFFNKFFLIPVFSLEFVSRSLQRRFRGES